MPPDPHVLASLKDKIYELRQAIVTYEENLERTRQELAVMTAAVTIYHRDGGRFTDTNPATVRNLYKRGEVWRICRASLSAEPAGMTTRELAEACLAAREFEHKNPVLLRAMVGLLSNTLKKAVRRRELVRIGEGNRKSAWRLPEAKAALAVASTMRPPSSTVSTVAIASSAGP